MIHYKIWTLEVVLTPPEDNIHVYYHTISRSSLKPLGQSKAKFIGSIFGNGEPMCLLIIQVTCQRCLSCPYVVKTLQKSYLEAMNRFQENLARSIRESSMKSVQQFWRRKVLKNHNMLTGKSLVSENTCKIPLGQFKSLWLHNP